MSKNSSNDFHAMNFQNTSFRHVAKHIYLVVYPRVKALAGYFIRHPFTAIPTGKSYKEVCGDSCLLYLFNTEAPIKDEIIALKEAAYKYNEWMNIVQGDYRCHPELFKHLGKEPHKTLAFFHEGRIFLFKEKVTLKMIDTLVKGFKTDKIKFKELPNTVKSAEECTHNIKSFEEYFREDEESDSQEQSE